MLNGGVWQTPRVLHGYTMGWVFPHHTFTCQNRYLWQVIPVMNCHLHGIIWNPQYLWYLQFLFIKYCIYSVNITFKNKKKKEGKKKGRGGGYSTPAIATATIPAATLALKTLLLLIGLGMGCCHTRLPWRPCSFSFVHACPLPCSSALHVPVHLCLHSHSFVCACLYSATIISASPYCVPAFTLVCTCLCLHLFTCICTCSSAFVLICSAWIQLHPHLPCFPVPVIALICPCHVVHTCCVYMHPPSHWPALALCLASACGTSL